MPTVEEREERRKAKLEALRAEIQKGFDSGPMEEIGDKSASDAAAFLLATFEKRALSESGNR